MSSDRDALRAHLRLEAQKVIESGKRNAAVQGQGHLTHDTYSAKQWASQWLVTMTNTSEDAWIAERVDLLSDPTAIAAKFFGLKFEGPLLDRRVHSRLSDHLIATQPYTWQRDSKKRTYLYLQARNTFKTTFFEAFTLQTILRDPGTRLAIASFRQSESEQRLREIRRVLESDEALHFFPDRLWPRNAKYRPSHVIWTKNALRLRGATQGHEPTLVAISHNAPQAGAHFTDSMVDDVVTERSVIKPDLIQKQIETWKYVSECSALGAIERVMGTFYSSDDLYNWLLQNEHIEELWVVPAQVTPQWLETYPQMVKNLGFKRTPEIGTLLFPGRLSRAVLEQELQRLGDYIFGCQYLLEPTAQTARLKLEWLQPFDRGQEPEECAYYMTGDPGTSKDPKNSEGALCVCGWDAEGCCWIVDLEAGHWNAEEFCERAATMYQRWGNKLEAFGMEKIGFQAAAHALTEYIVRRGGQDIEINDLYGAWLGIRGRVSRIEAPAAMRKIYCQREFLAELLPQWKRYPDPSGKKMDRLDALAYQFALDKKGTPWVRLPMRVREPVVEAGKALLPSQQWPFEDRRPMSWDEEV